MAAIVRVKRRRNEEPAESLIVSCKRSRLTSEQGVDSVSASADVKTVFKFAVTVPEQASQDVSQHIRTAIRKEKLEKEYKHHNVTHETVAQSRHERSNAAKNSRYKITAKHRGPNLEALDKQKEDSGDTGSGEVGATSGAGDEKLYHLYDVVQDGSNSSTSPSTSTQEPTTSPTPSASTMPPPGTITCNGMPMQRTRVDPADVAHTANSEYVYDLYYMNNYQFDFRMLENVLAIEAQRSEDLYYDYRDDAVCEVCDDDSDSNSEGNWRNDYPDEDPYFFENETAEYAYGDDGHNPDHAFDDVDGIAALIEKKLLADDTQSSDEEYNSDDAHEKEVYSDVVDSDLEDVVPDGDSTEAGDTVRPPTRSYDAYKRQILRELGEAT